jgi:hypothetical protein
MNHVRAKMKRATKLIDRVMFAVYDPRKSRLLTGFQMKAQRAAAKLATWSPRREFPP